MIDVSASDDEYVFDTIPRCLSDKIRHSRQRHFVHKPRIDHQEQQEQSAFYHDIA